MTITETAAFMSLEEFEALPRSRPTPLVRNTSWIDKSKITGKLSLYRCDNHPVVENNTYMGYPVIVRPIQIVDEEVLHP